jgi:hypothetical protein
MGRWNSPIRVSRYLLLSTLVGSLAGCLTLAPKPPPPSSDTAKDRDSNTPQKVVPASGSFSEYDRALFGRIKKRWLEYLEEYTGERSGQVKVCFDAYADGSIRNLLVQENTAGNALASYCRKAIEDSAPFDPWPDTSIVFRDYREIAITFYY